MKKLKNGEFYLNGFVALLYHTPVRADGNIEGLVWLVVCFFPERH